MSVPKKAANHGRAAKPLHFITPTAELEVMKKSTPGVNLVHRQGLTRFESEMTRKLRKGFTQFLSPQLQVLVKEKPRIMLAEKADFGELLNEELSGRPIQELSVDLLRKSFTTRRRVGAPPPMDDAEAVPGRAPVPSDVPVEDQTTNKLSSAYMKKQAKRSRPVEDVPHHAGQHHVNLKSVVKPLVSKLMQMKWTDWSNPFSTVITRKNAPPRYFDYIKRPMNLTYIRENLARNKYSKLAEVEADLDLIVSNALTFNRPIDPVYKFALELQAAYRSELPHVRRALGLETKGYGDVQLDKKARVR